VSAWWCDVSRDRKNRGYKKGISGWRRCFSAALSHAEERREGAGWDCHLRMAVQWSLSPSIWAVLALLLLFTCRGQRMIGGRQVRARSLALYNW
jgi:hypothetical protein